MYLGKKVSLIFPAYNEEKNIGTAIEDFKKLGVADEILVIDNNSTDRTSKIATTKRVKVINEKKKGYGNALKRGMREAAGDYIVLCEPDGTFRASDLLRLLKLIDKYDIVTGTRTNVEFIGKGANMGGFLLWGNRIVSKFIQLLYFSSCSLSDCGCTYRIMKKEVIKKVLPKLKVGGSYFLSELVVLCLLNNFKMLEIPVHYSKRVGESKITGSVRRSIMVGMQMIGTVIRYRFYKII